MKNKRLFIILVATLLLTSCNSKDVQLEMIEESTPVSTGTAINTQELTSTTEPTPNPTAEPTEPKYIFIVIGDGLGRGAMTLGEIYARLESEDMSKGAVWEDFTYQSYVTAMGESASGGTALASGVESEPWYIGKNIDGQELYTIMDRAKEAGMGTGVITNSSITDATPATFLSHITNRYSFIGIAKDFPESNVDYMAGGGLISVVAPKSDDFFNGEDALHMTPELVGSEEVIPTLVSMGYETYFGLEGSVAMRDEIQSNTYNPEKSINLFTGGIMPYEYYKYRSTNSTKYDDIPTLVEMTQAGIQSLSQNENGFVMMIESALIDKCGHKFSQEMEIYEINFLNKVLDELMDFYNEHPYETLIILTSDHETGNYAYNDKSLDKWKASASFSWTDDGGEMASFAKDEWDVSSYSENLQTQINIANVERWDTDEENRIRLYTAVTMDVAKKYGTKIRTANHSGQLVPLFVIGNGSQEFEGSTHIKEVPITICEIMGWKALPEVIVPES